MKVSAFSGYSWPTHINANEKKSLYCWYKKKFRNKYLRQPSIDFDFCNGRWLTQASYWFILRFCEHFTCLSSKIQNAIKLENISNLITWPSSYQCIRRKTRLVSKLVHFVIHCRHISMEWMIPKCKFSKQMIKKYLFTEYLLITEGGFLF